MDHHTGRPQTLKLLNQSNVESIIRSHGPITKPQIATITKLSLVTVNKTVEALLQQESITCLGLTKSSGGRSAKAYGINKEQSYIICLYYEKMYYWSILANMAGEIIYEEEFFADSGNINEATYKCIDKMFLQVGNHKVSAIGLGIPGVVRGNIVTDIPQIPQWEGYPLVRILETKYNCSVFIENDINLAASGLYFNHYKDDYEHLVLLYLNQGIGSGLIINRDLFKGFSNFAGEIGCLEIPSYENGSSTIPFEKKISLISDSLKKDLKDDDLYHLKEELYWSVAYVVGNIACILNPEIVALQCDLLAEDELELIRKNMKLSKQDCPKLVLVKDFRQHCINGVLNMCIQKTRTVLTLLNK